MKIIKCVLLPLMVVCFLITAGCNNMKDGSKAPAAANGKGYYVMMGENRVQLDSDNEDDCVTQLHNAGSDRRSAEGACRNIMKDD